MSLKKYIKSLDNIYGQVIIGPPGSGKTTYCNQIHTFYKEKLNRKVEIINLDPANDNVQNATVDIMDLITVDEVMTNLSLGPNGALMYCMEYLEQNYDWLLDKLNTIKHSYLLFDMPGQVELYTHHNSIKNIFAKLEPLGYHLCAVHMVDSHYCSDPSKFISTLLLSLSTMLQIGLPHVNVLSKADLLRKNSEKLDFGVDFYTDVLDLKYLLELLDDGPFTKKYKKLNASLIGLIEDYSLVSFIPVDIKSERSLLNLKSAVDKLTMNNKPHMLLKSGTSLRVLGKVLNHFHKAVLILQLPPTKDRNILYLVELLYTSLHTNKVFKLLKKIKEEANGYVYGSGEERSIQALLACAVGARTETERFDVDFI